MNKYKEQMSESNLNALWNVWYHNQPLKLPNTNYTLVGFSIAALRTNFIIPELNIMFDAGLATNMCPDYVMCTHQHLDHSASLAFVTYNPNKTKVQIYVPNGSEKKIYNMMESYYQMSFDNQIPDGHSLKHYQLLPVTDGEIKQIIIKNKKFNLEILACDHSVRCMSYGLTEIRVKLKDEYLGLAGKEIAQLKKSGVDINKYVELPVFLYIGDTSKKILENKALEKYLNIMIECTFIMDDDLDQADETKHMHWKHLEQYVLDHPNNFFILYHFSQRYKKQEIDDFFEKLSLKNVYVWNSN